MKSSPYSPFDAAQPEIVTRRFWRRLWFFVLYWVVRVLLRIDEEGRERVPRSGPLIIYYNHIHSIDPAVIMASMLHWRYVAPLGKQETAEWPLIGRFIPQFGAILIARGEADIDALRACQQVLENGHALLIAPEGTRNQVDFSLQAGRRGMAFLVRRTSTLLIPVAVWGTEEFGACLKRGRRTPVTIRWGRPFRLEMPPGLPRKEAEAVATEFAMQELAGLLPESMRGVYQPPAGTPDWVTYL